MRAFLKELFEYNHYCNQELSQVFLQHAGQAGERPVKLFSHLLNAHRVWNCRIRQQQSDCGIWDVHAADVFDRIDRENLAQTMEILGKEDTETIISYRNSKGEPFSNSIRDILFHVINHSTYHRGQIALLFRQGAIDPVPTDYIFYKR